MLDLSRYKKPIIIALIVLGVMTVGWLVYYYFFTFSVTSVTPQQGRVAIQSPILEIATNRTIADSEISIDDGGEGIVASAEPYGKSIIVNLFENMKADRQYTITLTGIKSTDGYSIDSFTYTFTPVDNAALLTPRDREIILQRQDVKPEILSDPVYNATPFYTDSYYVSSTLNATPDGKGSVSLQAVIFLSRDEAGAGRSAAVKKYTAAIEERLRGIEGFSADKYPVTYRVQEP